MNRIIPILLGALGLVLIAWLCVERHAPAIEADLTARGRITLDDKQMDWARIRVDGRDGVLSGVAPSEKARVAAGKLIAGLDGMRSVENRLHVMVAQQPPAETPKPGPLPYELTLRRTGDRILLQGLVPNPTARAELRETAQRYFGDGVADELEIAAGAPGDWLDVAKGSLHHLSAMEDGVVELRNTRLRVKGTAKDENVRKQIEDAIANQTPVTYSAHAEIKLSLQTILDRCQKRFDTLLETRQIQFATGSAAIESGSYPLLDELVAAANRCPRAHLAIAGHTDSIGSAEANLALSEERAKSVADYLIQAGIPATRLSSKGYGDSRPLTDNETPEGRSRNRRIEIEVHQGN